MLKDLMNKVIKYKSATPMKMIKDMRLVTKIF